MLAIIGLGNPEDKLKNTRHNTGFMVVDFFAKENGFPDFELSKKCESLVSEKLFDTAHGKDKIMLAKPQTFMNKSGHAVKKILNHKSKILNLILVHDDLDLPLGKIKIVKNRGSAGHKGVESIIKSLGSKDFIRIRLGIQPEGGKPKNTEIFIVENFTKKEREIINKAIKKTAPTLTFLIENGLEKTMSKYN